MPMLSPHATTVDAYRTGSAYSGVERYVVIMFVDMRGSSRLAEGRLPFDTVFVINQFLNAVSSAVLGAGGEPNQILGDGLLALFGMGGRPETACRQAIAACAAIAARVETLNGALAYALLEPIRFGIGIHAGVTIAGNIGYERHAQFTVIGDPVNVAARLEEMTKTFGCEVMMSEEVYERAGFGPDDLPAHDVAPRGREAGHEGPERRPGGRSRRLARRADAGGFVSGRRGDLFHRHLRRHRIGDEADLVGLVVQMLQFLLVRSRTRPLDSRVQHDLCHRQPSWGDVPRHPLRMVGIGGDRKAGQPGDVQERQHMAAGQSGDQHLFRIDRGLHRPFADDVGRSGAGDCYAAVEAHIMRAAEAALWEIVAVLQRPSYICGMGRHLLLLTMRLSHAAGSAALPGPPSCLGRTLTI